MFFCRDASLKERQTGENIVFRPQHVGAYGINDINWHYKQIVGQSFEVEWPLLIVWARCWTKWAPLVGRQESKSFKEPRFWQETRNFSISIYYLYDDALGTSALIFFLVTKFCPFTLYTLTSVSIFSILFTIHFQRGWQRELLW